MMLKIYRQVLLIALTLGVAVAGKAQTVAVTVNAGKDFSFSSSFNEKDLQAGLNGLSKAINVNLKSLVKNLNVDLKGLDVNTGINTDSTGISISVPGISLNFTQPQDNQAEKDDDAITASAKYKNYSKSYSLDANDKIRLSNQYGRITVNTWDRREVKVDVQIKAEADDDGDAQKLLDGVTIEDNKSGDQVNFKTEIARNNGNSWSIWNWGRSKTHKLTINYTVYMPVKTDLNVEDSYGAIVLPDLDGRVKITSSYGSVTAQNLNNSANEIDGSYGNMKVVNVNGAHVDYSYGNLEMEQCNTLHANLSYGSFKIGKLKGAGDLNVSYVGGFKIGELASSFSRLNINADYSSVALGIQDNDSFNFDVTTSYGGFNFNDNKITLTSKPSADGRHYSSSKNYKGYMGKSGSDARINIQTSYGSVNFQ